MSRELLSNFPVRPSFTGIGFGSGILLDLLVVHFSRFVQILYVESKSPEIQSAYFMGNWINIEGRFATIWNACVCIVLAVFQFFPNKYYWNTSGAPRQQVAARQLESGPS